MTVSPRSVPGSCRTPITTGDLTLALALTLTQPLPLLYRELDILHDLCSFLVVIVGCEGFVAW